MPQYPPPGHYTDQNKEIDIEIQAPHRGIWHGYKVRMYAESKLLHVDFILEWTRNNKVWRGGTTQ